MNKYQRRKERAREQAIEWQHTAPEDLSYGESADVADYFQRLAKRYGLTAEFRENGII